MCPKNHVYLLSVVIIIKVLPEYLSVWTTEKVKAEGVNIINNAEVKAAKLDESGKISLSLNDGQILETDHVIVAVGIEPETQLAKNSGLEIDGTLGGFKVNDKLESRYVQPSLKIWRTPKRLNNSYCTILNILIIQHK